MSKLDYITVAIVAACILAIIFLVYKMTDLFNDGEGTDKIETVQDSVELEDDVIYDYEIDDAVDSTGAGQSAADTETTSQPATTTPVTSTTSSPEKSNIPTPKSTETERITSSSATSSGGKFMVFGGTFTQKALANEQVAKLKKMGYQNASIEIFDRGKYAVVLVDRFEYMADAERLVKKLKTDGITCYIKTKER